MQSLKKNWLLVPKMVWGIWWISIRAVASLKIWTLMFYFRQEYIMFEPKKRAEKLCVITLENLRRNWLDFEKTCGGTDLCSEKWHEEFAEFWPNTRKSQNVQFNGLLLTKKLQRSYVSWQWRVIQYLKKNWLAVGKIT